MSSLKTMTLTGFASNMRDTSILVVFLSDLRSLKQYGDFTRIIYKDNTMDIVQENIHQVWDMFNTAKGV